MWDNNALEFIAIDKNETESEFDKLPEVLTFKNIILKMTFEIFKRLPPFQQ